MQISDIFYHHKNMDIPWITSFESIFTEKPEEILSKVSLILDENPNFGSQLHSSKMGAYSKFR